jgi:hypothetical protein
MPSWLGLSAVVICLIGYLPYLWGMYCGWVKPHAFSWLIWGLLTGIAYAAQVADQAGPGSWVTGVTAAVCLAVAVWAWLRWRLTHVARIDWYFFAAALAAIPLWLGARTPFYSVIWITVIDALAYVPTFRKSWLRPYDEALFTYVTNTLKFLLALAALPEQTVVSSLYPWSLVVTNSLFIGMVMYRRGLVSSTG